MTTDLLKWIYAVAAALLAAGILLRILKIVRAVTSGMRTPLPIRTASPARRVSADFSIFFERTTAAALHTVLLVSFLLMAVDLALHAPRTLAGDAPDTLLHGTFPTITALFAAGAILGALAFLSRRYVLRLPRFDTLTPRQRTDATVILLLETASAATYLLMYFAWPQACYAHYLIMLAFGLYVTFSKHLHILSAPFYMAICGRRDTFRPDDMPEVAAGLDVLQGLAPPTSSLPPRMGTRDVSDLPRHEIISSLACTECGRCDMACPAVEAGETFSPRRVVTAIRRCALDGKHKPLYEESITRDEVFSCISCGACLQECPIGIDPMSLLLHVRRYATLEEGSAPREQTLAAENVALSNNPWGIAAAQTDGLPEARRDTPVEYLLWRGPMGIYDPQGRESVQALARLLDWAEVSWAALPQGEECDPSDILRYGGDELTFLASARKNISTFSAYGVRKIVTPCPHSFIAFKNYYPSLNGHYEVSHSSQFLWELIKKGKLTPGENLKGKRIAYHDPCRLARTGVTDAPRQIITSLGGILVETPRHSLRTGCCGGGDFFSEGNKTRKIAALRREELLSSGADLIVTDCPFCLRMLADVDEGTPVTTLSQWLVR